MVAARGRVTDRLYIESVSRFDGPSLSGRMIAAGRLARTLTQHPHWQGGRWGHQGSVLQDYVVEDRPDAPLTSVFVTLGTIRPYQFTRLVERIVAVLPPEVDVVWQVGETDPAGLPGEVHRYLSAERFDRAVEQADVVITHAGIGTLLGLLEAGVRPIAVPREARFDEHVDDHQAQAARVLMERGLALTRRAHELTWDDIVAAGRARISRRT
jgi:UDP-N-acetylglucosamine transferase subunit ALG13